MKYCTLILFAVISCSVHAQSLKDADDLFRSGHYGKAADIYMKHAEQLVKKRKHQEAEALKPLIERSQRLDRMVSRCEDVEIIDSVSVDKSTFLRYCILSCEAGTVSEEGGRTVYENQLKTRRIFSEKRNGQASKLYQQIRVGDGWTDAKPLNLPADSAGEDSYPFLTQDGLTLYFASTGNGSVGGYDIFASTYNLERGSYLTPTQLGMPFNSTYNDYLYAVDEFNGIGYFATDRFQPEGKVVIYTFIPNKSFKAIENAGPDILASRSRITSIRDTWREGKNYRAILEKALLENITDRPAATKDFTFVINDNIIYHTVSEFESDAAKKTFINMENTGRQIKALEEKLEKQRREYAVSSAGRNTLKQSILAAERNLENLYAVHKEKIKETRNLEIKYLRTDRK
ncbi:MAG: hypothetical protein LBJ17_03170 [Dysgonamonadaceae bacterium]|nr:hypothetical protein [Dysgonamonadaceae bacterium]